MSDATSLNFHRSENAVDIPHHKALCFAASFAKGQLMRFKSKPFRKRWDRLRGKAPGWFLKGAKGVIHIGANNGAEWREYAEHGLNVLWVEPIPEVFAALEKNISGAKNQTAVKGLVSDISGKVVTLNISSNDGQSSSVLNLDKHAEIWPEVSYVDAIELVAETLPEIVARSGRSMDEFDILVMDTQGSELAILQGAGDLSPFRYIHTEAADFELYAGYPRLAQIDAFLSQAGFKEAHRWRFAQGPSGKCYDVTFRNHGK
ncbi:MAG: FkbM family methyltransferase [Parvibaculum sp.]|nr:FkbM family methyltransferase [Parvibaculum sp.]